MGLIIAATAIVVSVAISAALIVGRLDRIHLFLKRRFPS